MKFYYCPHCGRETGHKRALGWGTFFAVLLTGGLWLLAIPFYPKRCIICGSKEGPSDISEEESKSGTSKKKGISPWVLVFVIPLTIYLVSVFDEEYKTIQPQPIQTRTTQDISKIQALLPGKPIDTPWEFEHSKYYKLMQFKRVLTLPRKISYASLPRNIMVCLRLKKGKIIESRFAYLHNKLPDFDTLTLDTLYFIASFTGVYTYNELKRLTVKFFDRMSDKTKQPFTVKGKTVIIDRVDTPLR